MGVGGHPTLLCPEEHASCGAPAHPHPLSFLYLEPVVGMGVFGTWEAMAPTLLFVISWALLGPPGAGSTSQPLST